MHEMTLVAQLCRAADHVADRTALVVGDSRVTYAQLLASATEVARSLIALGVKRGDNVGILLSSSVDFASIMYGSSMIGAAAVPLNVRFKKREMSHILAKADITVLFTTDKGRPHQDFFAVLRGCLPALAEAVKGEPLAMTEAPTLRHVINLGSGDQPGAVGWSEFRVFGLAVPLNIVEEASAAVTPDDTALIPFTSGTTSWPKGCVLTHDSLCRTWGAAGERLQLVQGDVCWAPAPMYHTAGYGALVLLVGLSGTVITQAYFAPDTAATLIETWRPEVWYAPFPPVVDPVIEKVRNAQLNVDDVRVALYAAPSGERFDWFSSALPHAAVVQMFGQTESTTFITLGSPDEEYEVRRSGCGANIADIEIKLVDPVNGASVEAPGQTGEIQFRGFNAFKEYYNEPKLTAETILDGGWVRTGDAAEINGHSQLVYTGRMKDMLKVGGENVSPQEIEAYLETHPDVVSVAVVAAPDSRLQEVPAAFVELRSGATLDEVELIDFCRGHVANYKVPRYVRFVTEWPMSATKVQKYKLREQIANELG